MRLSPRTFSGATPVSKSPGPIDGLRFIGFTGGSVEASPAGGFADALLGAFPPIADVAPGCVVVIETLGGPATPLPPAPAPNLFPPALPEPPGALSVPPAPPLEFGGPFAEPPGTPG